MTGQPLDPTTPEPTTPEPESRPPLIRRLGSGGPWEERFGYSRVVRVGPLVVTAGCTAVVDGRLVHPGDAYRQALTAFGIGLAALTRVGATADAVISTRMYLTDLADSDDVGRAHGELFGAAPPVATMVGVVALLDPQMLIEVELTAWIG